MIKTKKQLYKLLDKLNIPYNIFFHLPTHHFEEHREVRDKIPGLHCKSLLLTDKNDFYLILMRGEIKLDLKLLQKNLKSKRLSFAKSEDMEDLLFISPGSCTPYALINDKEHKIRTVICDGTFKQAEIINFHPLENDATIQVCFDDFVKWLNYCKHSYIFMDLEEK